MNTVTFFKITNITEESVQKAILLDLLQFMSEKEIEENIVYDAGYSGDSEYELVFAFVSDINSIKIKNVFEKHDILIIENDITNDVLMCDFENNNKWQDLFNKESIMNFKPILDNFLRNNLTKNNVLDKINKKGIDSLTTIDYEILNS